MKRTVIAAPLKEDWKMLRSSLPEDWKQFATDIGALGGLCKCKCPDVLLRTLLIRLGCRHSLGESVVRAYWPKLAEVSSVALLKIPGLAVRTL